MAYNEMLRTRERVAPELTELEVELLAQSACEAWEGAWADRSGEAEIRWADLDADGQTVHREVVLAVLQALADMQLRLVRSPVGPEA